MRRLTDYTKKHVTTPDGLKLYYERHGTGKEAILFIHGLGGDVAAWDEERVFFHRLGYTTIAVDLRGHGYSDHAQDEDGYGIERFADDIHALIEAENLKDFILVGHCFGGMVAFLTELIYPGRAKALILIDSSYKQPYFSQKQVRSAIKALTSAVARISPRKYTPRHVDYSSKGFEHDFEPFGLVGVIKHNSLKTFLKVSKEILGLNVLDKLSQITIPTLLIVGTADTIYPVAVSQDMHKKIASSRLVLVDRGNHPVVLNNPMEVSVHMQTFLSDVG